MGRLLLVKIAKIVIYDNARLNGVGLTMTKDKVGIFACCRPEWSDINKFRKQKKIEIGPFLLSDVLFRNIHVESRD